ncbi:MAG: TPM domain-containing protein [Herminiimonas sp.]|nr:TPM domain-containing protein [Herminiimonas sp.]
MDVLTRIFRNLSTTKRTARRAFPPATLKTVQIAIGEGELRHRAQLRLIIEPALPLSDLTERTSARGRAHALFSRYRVWDTEENCGVLIYINLAERKVEIITDRAVDRLIRHSAWETTCEVMTRGFAAGNFHDSLIAGVSHANLLLSTHFPVIDNDPRTNELSDHPVIL